MRMMEEWGKSRVVVELSLEHQFPNNDTENLLLIIKPWP